MRKKRKCNEAQIELEMENEITEAKNRNKKKGLKDYTSHKKRSRKSKLRTSWAPTEHVASGKKAEVEVASGPGGSFQQTPLRRPHLCSARGREVA